MSPSQYTVAFGAPGIQPRWTSSAKEGVGTASLARSRHDGVCFDRVEPAFQQYGALNLWFADFPTKGGPAGSVFALTCFWMHDQHWQGHKWQMSVL